MSDRFVDSFEPNSPLLELKNVSLAVSAGLKHILKNISFSISRGDRLVIVGPSGSGKTNLLRLLNRLNEPNTGSIYFQNRPIVKIPIIELRQQVVLVAQEPKLLGMTVAETLAYPLVLQQLPRTEIRKRVTSARHRMHVPEDWLDRNELQLSQGQKQMVAIARAIAMRPKILLLDEPTSALDAGNAFNLIDVLNLSSSEEEITTIMVNHQLDVASRFATKTLYLEGGEILEFQIAERTDWSDLRNRLIRAETKAANEWLEDDLN